MLPQIEQKSPSCVLCSDNASYPKYWSVLTGKKKTCKYLLPLIVEKICSDIRLHFAYLDASRTISS
jgi:hypothetical protein